jgi:hypothetical protein
MLVKFLGLLFLLLVTSSSALKWPWLKRQKDKRAVDRALRLTQRYVLSTNLVDTSASELNRIVQRLHFL